MAAAQRSASARAAGAPDGQARADLRGAGGVGKTTTSAALALGLAARGQKVAVVTIDPAARLACALGLERALGRAAPDRRRALLAAARASSCEGELWAMMLDAKRTFDDDRRAARARRARARGDPRQPDLPRALHGGRRLAGAQRDREAVRAARGARVRRDRARHAAVAQRARLPRARPTRLLGFLEGRALQVFLAPGGLDARACSGAATALVFAIFARVTGVDMLGDLSTLLPLARRA